MAADQEPADPERLEEFAARARARAREAADRAASARRRAIELAHHGHSEPDDARDAQTSAQRQATRTRDALLHSAEGHDRTARVHDDAADFAQSHGRQDEAEKHRAAADRSRQMAADDRGLLGEGEPKL